MSTVTVSREVTPKALKGPPPTGFAACNPRQEPHTLCALIHWNQRHGRPHSNGRLSSCVKKGGLSAWTFSPAAGGLYQQGSVYMGEVSMKLQEAWYGHAHPIQEIPLQGFFPIQVTHKFYIR